MKKNQDLKNLIRNKTNLNLNFEKVVFKKFRQGKVNKSFLFYDDNKEKKYILRINSNKAKLFNINRKNEALILKSVSEAGIAPKLVFSDPNYNFLITEFLEGSFFSKDKITKNDLNLIKQLINKYQKINIDLPKFNYYQHVKKYEKVIFKQLKSTTDLRKILDNFYPLLEEFQNQDWSPVLCHHDLNPSNIIKTAKGIKIIDWEFAGNGFSNFDYHFVGLTEKDKFLIDLTDIINRLWDLIYKS